jgi:hypothetical protein
VQRSRRAQRRGLLPDSGGFDVPDPPRFRDVIAPLRVRYPQTMFTAWLVAVTGHECAVTEAAQATGLWDALPIGYRHDRADAAK